MTSFVDQCPSLPLTLAAAEASPDWLARPWWPVQQRELREFAGRGLSAIHEALKVAPPELAPILRLVAPAAANWCAAVDETALLASNCCGQVLAAEPSLMQRSLFDAESRSMFLKRVQPKANPPMRSFEAELRHMARGLSWSSPGTLLRNLYQPKILAVAHNPLLVATARCSAFGVGFCHADIMLDRARTSRPAFATDLSRHAATLLVEAIGARDLPGDIEAARQSLLHDLLRSLAARAESDLASLREERLTEEIWTGTFGKWASRAVGLTVLMRGGKVVAFDHGGGVGNVCDPAFFQVMEVCGGAHFNACSPMAADMIRNTLLKAPIPSENVVAGRGDPSFKTVPLQLPHKRLRSGRRQPRVVYTTTVFRGHRQYLPALLPDPLYLHWQQQILLSLRKMPIDALFKPAPEGLLRGKVNPLASIIPTSMAPFEKHLPDADCLIFDYGHTTTLWKALCGNAAVILLDLGVNALGPTMRRMIAARARIITVAYDENGIPQLDQHEFYDAVMKTKPGDPSPFRTLIGAQPSEQPWPLW